MESEETLVTDVTVSESTVSADPADATVSATTTRESMVAEAVDRVAADEQLVAELADRARTDGVNLIGEDGLLKRLTKTVVEAALEGEMDEHLGYSKHDSAGRDGGNSRNGTRAQTVVTEAGPVEVEVPRDRQSQFDPVTVGKRQRRLNGIDEIVLSLSAKGLTSGEVSAHLAEVYGASVSKQTISSIPPPQSGGWCPHRSNY